MNRIQGKNHRIGTYEINKTFFSGFDKKIYIPDNGIDAFPLGASSKLLWSDKYTWKNYFKFWSNNNRLFVRL